MCNSHNGSIVIQENWTGLSELKSLIRLFFMQDPAQRRHLLRLWVAPEVDRPLPPKYAEIYGGTLEIGNRGGIKVPEESLYITTDAEA
jgi:hypothetical protein